MNKHNSQSQTFQQLNIIGKPEHRNFIEIQAEYGIAKRGGSFPTGREEHAHRLVSTINQLSSEEKQYLVFSEIISKN